MNKLINRPSPAMGVAFVALLAALTTTAVALPGSNTVTSGDIRNGAVRSADIKNNSVRGRDLRSGSATGVDVKDDSLAGTDIDERSLGKVPSATTADSATTATTAGTAGPRAFARVEDDGTVPPQLAKGVTSANVTNPDPGFYCFDLPFNPRNVLVTNEADQDNDEVVSAIDADSPDAFQQCPATNEVEVAVFDTGTNGNTVPIAENGDFYIQLN